MKTSRSFGVLSVIACSAFAVATFTGCADDNTCAGSACKDDSACCSAEKSACCKDKAADAKTTDTKAHDSMGK